MSNIEQPDLDGFLEIETRARESSISKIETQKHLAKWGLRFEKYAHLSKDPIFKRRMMAERKSCFNLMTERERG